LEDGQPNARPAPKYLHLRGKELVMKRTVPLLTLASLLGACDLPPEDQPPGAPALSPGAAPAAIARKRLAPIVRTSLGADHALEVYDFGDHLVIGEIAPVGVPARLTAELMHTRKPAEIVHALAPGLVLPEAIEQAGPLQPVARPTAATGEPAAAPSVRREHQASDQVQVSTGQSGCSVQWVIDHSYPKSSTFQCLNAANGGEWVETDQVLDWCSLNMSWSFVYLNQAETGFANLCVDSGPATFYVEHDANHEYTESSIPSGYWANWGVAAKYNCSFWQYITNSCYYSTDRFMKFGFKPTGRAHWGGAIYKK
jgi:hypothetical protein